MANAVFRRWVVVVAAMAAMLLAAASVEAQYGGVYNSAWGQIRLDQQSDGRVFGIYTIGVNGYPGKITGVLRQGEDREGQPYVYVQGEFRDNYCPLLPSECKGSVEIHFPNYPETLEVLVEYRVSGGSEAADAFRGRRVPFGDEDFDS